MLLLLLSLTLAQDDPAWGPIEDLGHPDIEVREAASATLRALGERTRGSLRRALESPDAEIRARASDLLAELPRSKTLVLKHADCVEVARILRDVWAGVPGPRISRDARTNSITLSGPEAPVQLAEAMVAELDRDPLGPRVSVVSSGCLSAERLAARINHLVRPQRAGAATDTRESGIEGQVDPAPPASGSLIIRTSPLPARR